MCSELAQLWWRNYSCEQMRLSWQPLLVTSSESLDTFPFLYVHRPSIQV